MPDIFGRELHDYSHLRMLADQNLADQQLLSRAAISGAPRHDFDAMGSVRILPDIVRTELNAQAVGYVTNNLEAIQSMVEEILYTDFRLADFIPLISDVPEGAQTYAYRVVDRVGFGKFIDRHGRGAPSANVGVRLVPTPLEYAGIVPEWTVEDLRQAMLGMVALDTETVMAGTTGAMDHIESVGLTGDTDRDWTGLTNLDTGTGAVTLNTQASNMTIPELTGDLVVALFMGEIGAIISDTMEVFGRVLQGDMCIYLSVDRYNYLTSTRYGDNADRTIWDFIKEQNPWTSRTGRPVMLKSVIELSTASAANAHRMITAVNDRRVMEMAIPIYPRILTTLDKGYSICAPMEYKVSPLNVKRPTTIRYRDAV